MRLNFYFKPLDIQQKKSLSLHKPRNQAQETAAKQPPGNPKLADTQPGARGVI